MPKSNRPRVRRPPANCPHVDGHADHFHQADEDGVVWCFDRASGQWVEVVAS